MSDVPAAVIASPLEGANWFDGNGCCDEVTPHVGSSNPINGQYFFAERYAVDWVQLDSEMRIYSGDPTELSSYAYYDAPIYAVADGTIVGVKDDLDDQVPGDNPPPGALQVSEFGGNHVVARFEQNGQTYYAFYAHLVPGSAAESVEVGQEIKAGEVVGRLGNSGNSDSPHLLPRHGQSQPAGQQRPALRLRVPRPGRHDGRRGIDPGPGR
ncbi:MAG: M23 family metallopeptidase [Ilumatobacteraceae bacterium]